MYMDTWMALAKVHNCSIRHMLAATQAKDFKGAQFLKKKLHLQAQAPADFAQAISLQSLVPCCV
jgi:hypothetical protein